MPKTIEVKHTWADDHILCATIVIDGEQEKEIWWCGWEGLAALTYYNDSPSAKRYVEKNELLTSELFDSAAYPDEA